LEGRKFTRELIGSIIETQTGTTIGILRDIVIDTTSGDITFLLVEEMSGTRILPNQKQDELGRTVIKAKAMAIDHGRIVIEQGP
jgi:sporulation protein YlmC with PRC-barrel domain